MRFLRTYLMPGLVFQSLVIGGGYGTGRELVEFFLDGSPRGGLFGMGVAMLVWGAVLAISFELARMSRHFDYRSFIGGLLGRGWVLYEFLYLVILVLILSVLGSASGTLLAGMTGLPDLVGIAGMVVAIGLLAFWGSAVIERFMSAWSIALYAVYLALVVFAFTRFGETISSALAMPQDAGNWLLSGARYAAYNVGIAPAILFSVRHMETRHEALTAGALAGAIGIIPAVLLFLALLGQYPEVINEAIPSDYLLRALDIAPLTILFQIVLFGTFIETGVGIIHGFNERVAGVLIDRGRALPGRTRVWMAAGLLTVSLVLADQIGLVGLIAAGYGTLTWGFWAVFVIPVLTLGLWRIFRQSPAA